MKIFYISLAIASSISVNTYSQGLTQNAEGSSSILFRGNSIGFDVTKTEISFGMNNLNKNPTTKDETGNNYFIKGISIKAGSEEGIGNLFSKGDLVPAATMRGFVGYSWSNMVSDQVYTTLDSYQQEIIKHDIDFDKSFRTKLSTEIDTEKGKINIAAQSTLFDTDLKASLTSPNTKSISAYITFLKSYNKSDDAQFILALSVIIRKARELLKEYEAESKKLREKIITEQERVEKNSYWKLSAFVYGGIDAMGFKRFDSFATASLASSFTDVDDRGGHLGVGINYQRGSLKLGLTYDYYSTNNFNMLTKGEYTLRQTVTSGQQSLIKEKKITAYSGKYGEVVVNRLNFDIIGAFKLDKEADNHILVNPYIRGNFFSRDTSLQLNTFNIGTGFYLFKKTGKFMGGLYIELPDVNNEIEKKKPLEDQNIRADFKRLTFGLVGRISINSLLSKQ